MKKKVLFIMPTLRIGGAEKSLLTILNLIDYTKYDVDLFLFCHNGKFLEMLPKQVNLLKKSLNYEAFDKNKLSFIVKKLINLDFLLFYHSMGWIIESIISKIKKEKLYIGWNHLIHLFNDIDLEKEYDTSIAFLERKTIYFNVDKVKAKKKIGFIHNDYSVYPYCDKLDRNYFKYYNNIATVSDHCKEVLINIFPEYKDKFIVIKNMVSKELILKLSKQNIENYVFDNDSIIIVSVGRLVKQKGFDRAIEICKILIDNDLNIKWYIIGEGEEKYRLENKIKESNLEKNFYLVGADINPYKWMKKADIYVQPSIFEGYGITVAEAKALNKAIVASDIPEFQELLENNKGLLAKNNLDFFEKIKSLIMNDKLKTKLISNLEKEAKEVEVLKELDKLYKVM